MAPGALESDIAELERHLESASTPAAEAQAFSVCEQVAAISPAHPRAEREAAVRGLLVANQQYYRIGDLKRSGEILRDALARCEGIEPALHVSVLLRCGEFEMLVFDVAAALGHAATASDLARASGLPLEESRAWVNYGMALDAAGLYRQADELWAHALHVLEECDDPRMRGNIWALRCPLGFRLGAGGEDRAFEACRESLACARAAPARYRDTMVCTALCNRAALEIQLGRLDAARSSLEETGSLANLGKRPRWLIDVLWALFAVREGRDPGATGALEALLAPERAPAAVYVIETIAVMAAMYANMGEAALSGKALRRYATERARALWAMLEGPAMAGGRSPLPGVQAGADATAQLLERLAVVAELRDDATGKHCFRVGNLSMRLARRAGLPEADLAALDLAARLHDIGKIAIPDAILLKPGSLDETEMHLMRSHTEIGADIVASGALPAPEAAKAIARHHHERWDGKGYPDGLAGEDIPLPARIAAIADVYDALTHERPYKHAWPHGEAITYIARMGGTQFDPRLARLFTAMMDEAASDLAAFLRETERAASVSPFVVAEERVARLLREDSTG